MRKKIISVVGARPNFIKVAPLHRAFLEHSSVFQHLICHTGQHFDRNMSEIFFEELELTEPDFYLGVGGGSHAEQTSRIMVELEKVLLAEKPDLVIVPGDVNSTMASSLVAAKMGIRIAHVEAGLRSFDRTMPEEINRIVTDLLADLLFVSEPSGLVNLKKEGMPDEKVFFVGNIMIDSLVTLMHKIDHSLILDKLRLDTQEYILVTFHRPKNVDSMEQLKAILQLLNDLSEKQKVVFPIHPRTRINMSAHRLLEKASPDVILLDPIGYLDFLKLTRHARMVITDSGGIQEETTFLGVPCITVRDNTERPVTVETGTNHLVGTRLSKVKETAINILDGNIKPGTIPELWDGKTAGRIVSIIAERI